MDKIQEKLTLIQLNSNTLKNYILDKTKINQTSHEKSEGGKLRKRVENL